MNSELVLIFCVIILLVVWAVYFGGELPHPFKTRTCQGKGWRNQFPEISNDEIRRFLSLFVDSFAFDSAEKLKLSPNDQIMDIYRALYPKKWMADSLEVETFAEELTKHYGINLGEIWKDSITLGDVFKISHELRADA